jgi:hypothetical protein
VNRALYCVGADGFSRGALGTTYLERDCGSECSQGLAREQRYVQHGCFELFRLDRTTGEQGPNFMRSRVVSTGAGIFTQLREMMWANGRLNVTS